MSWVRLDDSFADHPKVVGLSDRAFRAHVRGLCYAARQLTDGVLSRGAAAQIASKAVRAELIAAGVWQDRADGGAEIHHWGDYNPPADEIRRQRQLKKERQQRWLEKKKNAKRDAPRVASQDASKDDAPFPAPKGAGRNGSSARPLGGALIEDDCPLCGERFVGTADDRVCSACRTDYPPPMRGVRGAE